MDRGRFGRCLPRLAQCENLGPYVIRYLISLKVPTYTVIRKS